jgi:hypothetical protein
MPCLSLDIVVRLETLRSLKDFQRRFSKNIFSKGDFQRRFSKEIFNKGDFQQRRFSTKEISKEIFKGDFQRRFSKGIFKGDFRRSCMNFG